AVERDVLDRADLVHGDGAGADDGPPRLDRQAWRGQSDRRALDLDDAAEAFEYLLRRLWVVPLDVGDAETAAEVDLLDLQTVPVADVRRQPHHPVRGDLEAGRLEDLRADVRVQPGELQR